MQISRRSALASLLIAPAWASRLSAADDPQVGLRVMTFNVRYGTAKDGENHWDLRKEFLVETIKGFAPDLLGTQETLGFQRDYLAEQLPGHAVIGVGRDDGKEKGEMMALYYKKDRFTPLAEGHFWLSDSPETIGSKSWDSSLPRMVTWIKLRDKRQEQSPPILFFNTHFDNRGTQARLQSAQLLRERINTIGAGCALASSARVSDPAAPPTAGLPSEHCSLILTGDFNSGEGSPPYKALFDEISGQPSPVVDCFRAIHRERGKEEGTGNAFDPARTTGSRIDWIACSREWKVQSAEINRATKNGKVPSDHFPVQVVMSR